MAANQFGIDIGQIIGARNALINSQQQQQLNALQIQRGQMDLENAPALNALNLQNAKLGVDEKKTTIAGQTQAQAFAKHANDVDMTTRALSAVVDPSMPDDQLSVAIPAVLSKLKADGVEGIDQLGQAFAAAGNDPAKLRAIGNQQLQMGQSYAAQLAQKNADRTFTAQQDNTKAVRESTDAYRAATLAQGAERNRQGQERIDDAKTLNGGPAKPIKVDSSSSSLNAQTGLSQFAINFLQGGPLPRGQAQQAQVSREIQDWSVANGIDTATLRSQATGINHVVQQNIIRNNQGSILEKELQGTIRTLSPIADAVGGGRINAANIIDIWAGKQVNNPDVQKYSDQLLRLRTELAGYNAVAAGKLTEQGTPRVDQDDMRAAEQVILSGINSGGLKGLQDSVGATTTKNRNVLQNSLSDANAQMWGLFGVGDNYKRTAPPLNLENQGGTVPPSKVIDFKDLHPGASAAAQVPGAR